MKRILAILFTAALSCALCVSVGAAHYEDAAKELSTIGIFRGTSEGFDLDRAPTRSTGVKLKKVSYPSEMW